jgi:hypothetical protein
VHPSGSVTLVAGAKLLVLLVVPCSCNPPLMRCWPSQPTNWETRLVQRTPDGIGTGARSSILRCCDFQSVPAVVCLPF